MLSLEGNTAPYLQYAYARIQSIFRKARDRGIAATENAGIALQSPHEIGLTTKILRLPEVVDILARELKPNHLCTYLYDLAVKFSAFFENCPVLQSEHPVRSSRLRICEVTTQTLALRLDLLGIEQP